MLFQDGVPGRVHQSLLWLFRRDPKLAVELACRVAGRPVPRDFVAVDRNAVLQRPGLRDDDGTVELDLLLTIHDQRHDGAADPLIRLVLIVEVQTVRDLSRAQAWFEYFAAAARELGVPTTNVDMLVVCPHASIREWLLRRVFPRMRVKPLMLEPRHVPWIDDASQARARAEAAVLSAVFHGPWLAAALVVEAAWRATAHLEPVTRARYRYLIQTLAHRQMKPFDTFIPPDPDEVPTEWEQQGLTWAQHGARFAARGRKEGELRARRADLLLMFELVGLAPTPEQRALVERCDDPSLLASWARRLKGASSLAAVLDQ